MLWVGLQCVIVVFPDHTQLLFSWCCLLKDTVDIIFGLFKMNDTRGIRYEVIVKGLIVHCVLFCLFVMSLLPYSFSRLLCIEQYLLVIYFILWFLCKFVSEDYFTTSI